MADILIIDDDIDSADALSMIMESRGHQVRVGYNGEDGMRLVDERHPDLVLLDVEMPVLDGPGMALQMFIHNMGLELIPVVLLSGIPDLARVAREVGTPYFLGKPYRIVDLVAVAGRALADRIAPRPPVSP
jgi:DNA-binding NtrC family response regulator